MLLHPVVTLLSIISYVHLSAALPFNQRDSKPAYSIVNVDGSSGPNPAATVTQFQTIALATVTETVSVTVTIKESLASETMIPTPSSQNTDLPASPTLLPSSPTFSSNSEATTTIYVNSMPTESTTSHDNGYWHTFYTGDVVPSSAPRPPNPGTWW